MPGLNRELGYPAELAVSSKASVVVELPGIESRHPAHVDRKPTQQLTNVFILLHVSIVPFISVRKLFGRRSGASEYDDLSLPESVGAFNLTSSNRIAIKQLQHITERHPLIVSEVIVEDDLLTFITVEPLELITAKPMRSKFRLKLSHNLTSKSRLAAASRARDPEHSARLKWARLSNFLSLPAIDVPNAAPVAAVK
jgi:hypothetical protein